MVVHLHARVPVCLLPVLDLLSWDLATCLAEGACRAKLDTQSSFGGQSLRSSSLRSEGSLGRASTASWTETIDTIDNGDDEMGITSKQPTGISWPGHTCDKNKRKRKEKLFSDHKGSLLRRQAGAYM